MKSATWWRIAVVVALFLAITAVVQVKRSGTAESGSNAAPALEPAKDTLLPRLVEVGAEACIPCQMMQPVLAGLRKEYAGRLQVDFVDVWKNPAEGDKYGVQIIPTQIFFDSKGKEVFRHQGFYPKEEIVAKFKELGIGL
jgi:thioredoxin 1